MHKKLPLFLIFFLLGLVLSKFFSPKVVYAGTLTNASDIISTSRPSSYTNLSVGVSLNDTNAIVVDNGSRWIASDSATIIGATTYSVTVASMSAANTPTSGKRTLYFATKATGVGHSGSVIYTPIPAKHTVSFRNTSLIPANGKIQIIFPVGVGNTGNLPAADSFSFNGIASNNISITGGGVACGSWTITEVNKTIQCNLSAGVTAPATITIGIGSSNATLLNPSKTAAAGTADVWTVQVKTLDSSSIEIDSAKVKIGTIDSVEVYATVDPTLTFTIGGIANGAAINVGNTLGCTNTETINTGFDSTATEVNLGVLGSTVINRSAQLLTVTTNGMNGYSLTATSSGHLIDPSIGYWIADAQGTPTANDTPVPAFLTAGTTAFGIHPCGLDVTTGTWGSGATGGGAGAKYANPSTLYYYSLASDSSGPIAGTLGNGMTSMQYGSTVSAAVPAGQYRTAMTFVATPTF